MSSQLLKVIKNARLPSGGEPVDMVLAGGKIISAGRAAGKDFPGAPVLDADGMTALPGYIDQHVHVTGGGGEGGFINRVPELDPTRCIEAGVTSLVGVLGTDSETRSVENLVAKTKSLRTFGLSAWCLTGAYEYPSPTLTGSVEKDIVFIEEIIGVKIAVSDHRSCNLSRAELVELASHARLGGLISGKPGVVHMHMGSGKGGLSPVFDALDMSDIPISVFRPTHVGRIFADAVEFARRGGYIDFTADEDAEASAKTLVRAFDSAPAGLITLSSDSNGSMPVWNERREMTGIGVGRISTTHEAVRALVRSCGVPLRDAVKPLTENVARALGLYPRKGALLEGSDADILLLDSDLNIRAVFVGGEEFMAGGAVKKKWQWSAV